MTTVTFISPYQAETFIAAIGVVVRQGESIDLPDSVAATLLGAPLVWSGTVGTVTTSDTPLPAADLPLTGVETTATPATPSYAPPSLGASSVVDPVQTAPTPTFED